MAVPYFSKSVITDIMAIDGVLVFASNHPTKNGLFGFRYDKEYLSANDLIEMTHDTSSLNL